jgi:hypothetical protein
MLIADTDDFFFFTIVLRFTRCFVNVLLHHRTALSHTTSFF